MTYDDFDEDWIWENAREIRYWSARTQRGMRVCVIRACWHLEGGATPLYVN